MGLVRASYVRGNVLPYTIAHPDRKSGLTLDHGDHAYALHYAGSEPRIPLPQ